MDVNFIKSVTKTIWLLLFVCIISSANSGTLPSGFVYLTDVDPTVIESPRYYGVENFLGKPVPGYVTNRIICTEKSAQRLYLIHEDLKQQGYELVVYDGYRPQRAVDEFMRWSLDEPDQLAKAYYYPTIDKKDVFKLGYVAEKSSHSRGSTFDLTLINASETLKPITYATRELINGETIPFLDDNTVDMGASFDLFHEASHHGSKLVSDEALDMRNILRTTMRKYGFKDYQEEWWHYTLADEPYPDTYFDFVPEV